MLRDFEGAEYFVAEFRITQDWGRPYAGPSWPPLLTQRVGSARVVGETIAGRRVEIAIKLAPAADMTVEGLLARAVEMARAAIDAWPDTPSWPDGRAMIGDIAIPTPRRWDGVRSERRGRAVIGSARRDGPA